MRELPKSNNEARDRGGNGAAGGQNPNPPAPAGGESSPKDATMPPPPLKPEAIMQFFAYQHLPEHMREASRRVCEVAEWAVANLPRNAERTAGLRELLKAKDCLVRALIFKE